MKFYQTANGDWKLGDATIPAGTCMCRSNAETGMFSIEVVATGRVLADKDKHFGDYLKESGDPYATFEEREEATRSFFVKAPDGSGAVQEVLNQITSCIPEKETFLISEDTQLWSTSGGGFAAFEAEGLTSTLPPAVESLTPNFHVFGFRCAQPGIIATIHGYDSDTIGIEGAAFKKIWGNETLYLQAHPLGIWVKIGGSFIPMKANMKMTGNQLLTAGSNTKMLINNGDSFVSAPSSMVGTNKIVCKRTGVYNVSFRVKMNTTNASQTNITIAVKKNGTTDILDAFGVQLANGVLTLSSSININLSENDYLELYALSSAGTYTTTAFTAGILSVIEIPTW